MKTVVITDIKQIIIGENIGNKMGHGFIGCMIDFNDRYRNSELIINQSGNLVSFETEYENHETWINLELLEGSFELVKPAGLNDASGHTMMPRHQVNIEFHESLGIKYGE